MTRLILALALLLIPIAAPAQEVMRYANGARVPQVVDDTHRLPVAGGATGNPLAGTSSTTFQAQSNGVAMSGPGTFYGSTITPVSGQGGFFLMIWDATSVPADGTVAPWRCVYVDVGPRSTTYGSSIAPAAIHTGIAWATSSGADCQTLQRTAVSFISFSFMQ